MSLRRPPNSALSKPNHSLQQVLNVSVHNDSSTPSIIDVNGVFLSTFPAQWSNITDVEYTKLNLTPEDPSRFPSSYKKNIYYAIVFKSPSSTYRFFVERSTCNEKWNVLARPPSDLKLYAPNEPGWECS